ncbi:PDR/VanB family oxidoreductase [Pseudonocardia xishanensis]|uniref:PDR/VanB family oxidoreductase n=1 Tax=Pseudonocardia xishanensis TaxID=630995 RepID=UPI003CD07931
MTTTREDLRAMVVVERAEMSDGVAEFVLAAADGGALAPWEPGAHIDLVVEEVVRQYSLCGDPEDGTRWRIGVLREPAGRGGSQLIHDTLEPGSRVHVRGPRNNFALVEASRYVFIAGGIGITPLLPMIRTVEKRCVPWTLVYGGRSRSTMAFLPELATYGDAVQLYPQDEAGLPDLDAVLAHPEAATAVYCCGPEPLLEAVRTRCLSWPPDALRVERFSRQATDPGAMVEDQPVEVVLSRSGVTVEVPADRSILEVAVEAGADALFSCEEGICGSCEVTVLEGVPDHRDAVLDDADRAAGDRMMICVSRSVGPRLVLDL